MNPSTYKYLQHTFTLCTSGGIRYSLYFRGQRFSLVQCSTEHATRSVALLLGVVASYLVSSCVVTRESVGNLHLLQKAFQPIQHLFVSSVRGFTDSSGILADGNERWTQNNPTRSEMIYNSLQPLKFQGVVRKLISKIGSLIENANGLAGIILNVSWKGHSSGL